MATETPRVDQQDSVVITGTRTEKLLADSPVKVEVVTSSDIRLKNARSLKDALKDVPGVLIRSIHGKSGYSAWMQGVDGERVLVLIDGDPVSKSTNNVTDLTQIGVMDIDRIEIVKGATSALYGSGAIGGVINVITRKSLEPLAYTLKADIGTHGSQNIDGNSSSISTRSSAGTILAHDGTWDAQFSYDLRDADGFSYDPSIYRYEREGPEAFQLNSQAEFGYTNNSGARYFASGAYFDEDLVTKEEVGSTDSKLEKNEQTERKTYRVGGDWLLGSKGVLKARYYYEDFQNRTEQDFVESAGLEKWREAEHLSQQVGTNWTYDANDRVIRTLGIEVFEEEVRQQSEERVEVAPGTTRNNKVFYAQDDWFVNEKLELLPGFRFQHDSDFGFYLAPKINGRYDFEPVGDLSHFLRFGVGRGYKAPSLKERYFNFDHRIHGYEVLGNEDLTPEYSDSFQLGWNISHEGLYSIDINLFRNHLEDFIETEFSHSVNDPLYGFVQVYEYTNVSKARTYGVEIASNFSLGRNFTVDSGYTYLEAENREDNLRLPKRPRHQVKSSVTYTPDFSPLSFDISARWQSEEYFDLSATRKSPGYSVFDISSNYQLSKRLSFYAGIDNIGDTQKNANDHFDLRPKEGRYVYIGMRIEDL